VIRSTRVELVTVWPQSICDDMARAVPNETKNSQADASEIVVSFICRIVSSQLADFYPPWSKLARMAVLGKQG